MSDFGDMSQQDLLDMDFKFVSVSVPEVPEKNWIRLVDCGELDKYVWTFNDINIEEDSILKFEIEVVNQESVPDELQKYGASIILKSLMEMIQSE